MAINSISFNQPIFVQIIFTYLLCRNNLRKKFILYKMSLILNIDTATEHASVCLSNDGILLALEESIDQKNHASFIQPAIKKIFSSLNLSLNDIVAISVTNGPGSYTGLRVGLASAKGLCFALNKPLIVVNTLEVMAIAAIDEIKKTKKETSNILFCPMIDARRMEVFTALFDDSLQTIMPSSAIIIDEHLFTAHLSKQTIIFSGNGSEKCRNIIKHPNAYYSSIQYNSSYMIKFSEEKLASQQFADLAYSEPFYLKEFYTPQKK